MSSPITTSLDLLSSLATSKSVSAAALAERARVAAVWRDWLPQILSTQCRDGSTNDGGFSADEAGGWYCGREAAYTLARLMAARLWARELGADAAILDAACNRALGFVRRRQHADGTLDLGASYASNEVGFPITGLAIALDRFKAVGIEPSPGFHDELLDFCVRGGEATLAGSPLTANHRWAAVCAPLAALHRLRPDARYLERIDALLAQGLDINADGCWEHERSPNYNNVATQGVLAIIDLLGRDDLAPPLLRHGEFVLHSLQPNGEMDATLSHRQDRARADTLAASYGVARRLAQLSGDGRFTSLAEAAWKRGAKPEGELVPLLLQLDAHPEALPAVKPLPDRYEVFFGETQQARVRLPRTVVSVSADRGGHFFDTVRDTWGGARRSDEWFHLHHGGVIIESLGLAGAGMQNLQPETLCKTGPGRYVLEADQPGWEHTLHFQPGRPKVPVKWDWKSRIDVSIAPERVCIGLQSSAARSLAAALVFRIRPGITLRQQDGTERMLSAGETIALQGGGSFTLTATEGSAVTVRGLPPAMHALSVSYPPGIASAAPATCASLTLGLLFPVAVNLTFELAG